MNVQDYRKRKIKVVQIDKKTRTGGAKVNWDLCIFCQGRQGCKKRSKKPKTAHDVSSVQFSQKIIHLAAKDDIMSLRLANINDLVAANAKYHRQCWVTFERKLKVSSDNNLTKQNQNVCMKKLCEDLLDGLARGFVYDMTNVFKSYLTLCDNESVQPSPSYISRRSTFYDEIQKRVGESGAFVMAKNQKQTTLLYPSQFLAKRLTNHSHVQSGDTSSAEESAAEDMSIPQGSTSLQELVHTALKIRDDLQSTQGHAAGWGGIDKEHVDKVVPQSLHLFLSVLFGGMSFLSCDEDKSANIETRICSIAQDIVYVVSNGRKLTPKHVGLGLTLHQATRSSSLVELFNSAGHTIGIDKIRRIDTTIADDILHRYDQNGYVYIADEIVPYDPGRVILASCDNIDVLEEAIDGKILSIARR